jgi:hypothetical protein
MPGGNFMLKLIPVFLLLLASCSAGNLESRHSSDLESRRIRRIAVSLPADSGPRPRIGTPPGEPRPPNRDPDEILARLLYPALSALPNWQIVSESEVREASQGISDADEATRLRRLGEAVYADAVLVGRMSRYRERVGDEWGAKSPASVSFVLRLVDVRRGDVIWSANFDETQKSLSENIFVIGSIGERGVRWLSADQLANDGVKRAVGQLHQLIARVS